MSDSKLRRAVEAHLSAMGSFVKVAKIAVVSGAVVLNTVSCNNSVRAATTYYGNLEGGVITITGVVSETGKTNTFSNSSSSGVYSKGTSRTLGANVSQIKTKDGGLTGDVYGIRIREASYVNATSITNGITLTATGKVCGICFASSDTSSISIGQVGSISVIGGSTTYGIQNDNVGTGTNTVTFSAGGTSFITATSSGDAAYGIRATGGTNIIGQTGNALKSITASVTGGTGDARGISNSYATNDGSITTESTTTVTFTGAGSFIIATNSGTGDVYGIDARSSKSLDVINLDSISATGVSSSRGFFADNGTNTVTFSAGGTSSIMATSSGAYAYGVWTKGGTNTIGQTGNALKSITAQTTGGSDNVYGILGKGSFQTTVTFTGIGSSITANSCGGYANGIYAVGSGSSLKVTGIETITVSGKELGAGINSYDGSSNVTVEFTGVGSSINVNVVPETGEGDSYGIYSCGSVTVSELEKISVSVTPNEAVNQAIGIDFCSGTNTVKFTISGGTITAKSKNVSNGIQLTGTSTNYIGTDADGTTGKELTSIRAGFDDEGVGSGTANGIYIADGNNTVVFRSGGSIKVKSNRSTAFGIVLIVLSDSSDSGENKIVFGDDCSIEAEGSNGSYGIHASGGTNDITFGTNGSITAKSTKDVYGIRTGNGIIAVTGLGKITVVSETLSAEGIVLICGARGCTNTVKFNTSGGIITAKSNSGKSDGIHLGGYTGAESINYIGTDSDGTTGKELTSIRAGFDDDGVGSGVATGIWAQKGTNTVAFRPGSSITAKSNGAGVYGIGFYGYITGTGSLASATGTTTISGLGSITAETTSDGTSKDAYGICAVNGNTDAKKFSVSLDSTNGGTINVYSAKGENCGIMFASYVVEEPAESGTYVEKVVGKSEVVNVKTIEAGVSGSNTSSGSACGIWAMAGQNTVTFTGAGSSITAKSTSGEVCGICVTGGTTTVTGLGGITVSSSGDKAKLKLSGGTLNLADSMIAATTDVKTLDVSGDAILNLSKNTGSGTTLSGDVKVATGKTVTVTLDADSKWYVGNLAGGGSIALTNAGEVYLGHNGTDYITGPITVNGSIDNTGTLNLGNVTLNADVTGAGTVLIAGAVTANANKLGSTSGIIVKNGRTLTLNGGKIQDVIGIEASGTGALEIATGDVSNTDGKTITVKSLTISGGSLTTDADKLVIGNDITNNGVLTLTAGTLDENVTGTNGTVKVNTSKADGVTISGTLSGGTFTVESGLAKYSNAAAIGAVTVVKNGGKLDPAANLLNADTTVESGGELYVSTGTLGVDIKGTGTTYIKDLDNPGTAQTITVNSNRSITGTLNGNGNTIDMTGDNTVTTLTVGTLAGITNLKIDVDMSNFMADKLAVTNIGSATVNLGVINITKDIALTSGGTLELPKEEDNKIIYVSDNAGTGAVSSGGTYTISDSATGSIEKQSVVTNNYKYTFTKGTTDGTLKYKAEAVELTFKQFAEGTLGDGTADPATLSLTADLVNTGTGSNAITVDTNQSNSGITVNLNGHNLTSAADSTVTVSNGKTFNLNGGSGTDAGTTDNKTNFSVAGTLAISGKTTVNGAVTNNNSLAIAGIVTLNGVVTGTGTLTNTGILNITAANLGNAVTNTDGTVNLGAGELTKVITGGTLNINEDVTAAANCIAAATNTIIGTKTLTLTGGALAGNLSGAGAVVIDGTVTSDKSIANAVTVNADKEFTNTGIITGTITNKGTLNLNNEYSHTTALDNDGTLNVTADRLKATVDNAGTVNLGAGTLAAIITGGQVNIDGIVDVIGEVTGTITVKNTGTANFYRTDYSTLGQISGDGTVNIHMGTIDDELFADKVESGTRLTLLDNGTYKTAAGNVFTEADATKTVSGAVISSATDKFNFVSGILEITDNSYTLDYLETARTALGNLIYGGVNSTTKLKMDGILVNAKNTEKSITTEQAASIGQQVELPKVTVKAEEGKINTLIGTITAERVEVTGVSGEIMDKQAEGFNVNKLDLAEGSGGIVITNDKVVVLGGDSVSSNNNLISVGGDDTKEVNVIVGVSKNEQVEGTTVTKGTFGIGIKGAVKEQGYKLNGSIIANEDSVIKINGNTLITGGVNLHQAGFEVGEQVTIKMSDLDLDDSSLQVAQTAKVETTNLKAGSTREKVNESSIVGEVKVSDTMYVRNSEISNATVTVTVGDANAKGVLSVKNIVLGSQAGDKWVKGVLFADPAWKIDEENTIGEASNIATETTALDGSYIAGQNSVIAFGTTDNQAAIEAFNASKLVWGPNEVTAAAYIHQNVDLGQYGDIMVDGSRTTPPGAQAVGTLNFAANSLLMVNGNICLDSFNAAIRNIAKVTVDSTSKIYIVNALKDTTYYILAGKDGVEGMRDDLWSKNNIILSDILEVDMNGTGLQNNIYGVRTKAKGQIPEYFARTVAPDAFATMRTSDSSTAAYQFMATVCDPTFSEALKIANLNKTANMAEESGVMHDHFTVTNISEDAVAQHLMLNNYKGGKEVWAQAVHIKENVSGLGLKIQGNSYGTQYNGAVIGADIADNGKTAFGAAVTYIDGKAIAADGYNEGKYYGATVYGRTKFGKGAGVQYDVTYIHSSNDMQMATGLTSAVAVSGNQNINSFGMGARVEQEYTVGKTSLIPHAGVRWLRIRGSSFNNSLGNSYRPDTTNNFILPLGISFKTGMMSEGWKMSFMADMGYQWTGGNRDYTQNYSYKGRGNSFDVKFADSSSWYAGAGVEFNKKNLTAGVGYRYSESANTKQNRWNVSVGWSF